MALSLLDRLTDLEPDLKKEAATGSWAESRLFKASLCRDLAVLLNTRRATEDFDPAYSEATRSLLSFGIADFTSFNLKNLPEQELVRRSMERAIREFEPRLARVTVSLETPDPLKPVLQFQISAILRTEDGGDPVVIDATLHRDSRSIGVSGADS
jgi:type VI secretion system protein ImpF